MARIITCPRCKKPTAWSSENPYRPFCSERCKLIDLGQWANEEYRIPVEEDDPNPEDSDPESAP